jgi:hypothetical protein
MATSLRCTGADGVAAALKRVQGQLVLASREACEASADIVRANISGMASRGPAATSPAV